MPYCIRPMHKEDIDQVTEIDREVFPTQWPPDNYRHELENQLARYVVACDGTKTPEKPEVIPYPEKVPQGLAAGLKGWLNHNRLFGNELPPPNRQTVAGFAGIWVLADEAHITNIAVRKRYQRQGIGELLLIAIADLSAELKASIITLEVRASNTTAQNLYLKYGFTQVGLRHAYYTDNREDGLIMSTESITAASFQSRLKQLKQAHSRRWGSANYQLAKNHPAQPDRR